MFHKEKESMRGAKKQSEKHWFTPDVFAFSSCVRWKKDYILKRYTH